MLIMDDYIISFAKFLSKNFTDAELDDTEDLCQRLGEMIILNPEAFKPVFENEWEILKYHIKGLLPEFIIYFYKSMDIEVKLKDILIRYTKVDSFYRLGSSTYNDFDYDYDYTLSKENLEGLDSLDFLNWHFDELDLPISMKYIYLNRCNKMSKLNFAKNMRDITICDCRSLKDLVVPEGIINLGSYSILNNQNLESLTLPKSLTKIHQDAIINNPLLANIIYSGSELNWTMIDKSPLYLFRCPKVKGIITTDGMVYLN